MSKAGMGHCREEDGMEQVPARLERWALRPGGGTVEDGRRTIQ